MLLGLCAGLLQGCAHTKVQQRHGCWVKAAESRWGDTSEVVTVCEPKAPVWSSDPIARAAEVCLFQAQMAWYNDALQRIRTDRRPLLLPDWNGVAATCVAETQRQAQSRIDQLTAQLMALEARARHLEEENQQLQDTIVACVEKSPNAIAEANATTESSSGAESTHESSMEQASPSPAKKPKKRKPAPAPTGDGTTQPVSGRDPPAEGCPPPPTLAEPAQPRP